MCTCVIVRNQLSRQSIQPRLTFCLRVLFWSFFQLLSRAHAGWLDTWLVIFLGVLFEWDIFMFWTQPITNSSTRSTCHVHSNMNTPTPVKTNMDPISPASPEHPDHGCPLGLMTSRCLVYIKKLVYPWQGLLQLTFFRRVRDFPAGCIMLRI